jgi:hypothetical protein
MDRILPERARCKSPVLALTMLLALLIFAPAAIAGVSSSAHYAYKVNGVQYKAEGQEPGLSEPSPEPRRTRSSAPGPLAAATSR